MRLRDIILAPKANVTLSEWTNDKPKKRDFPLSLSKRGGAFPLTRKWRWAVVDFDAKGLRFRLLVAYHVEVPEFKAVLGQVVGSDTRVILRLEYHANHPKLGWHVHANCEELDEISLGAMKPLGQARIPGAHDRHRRSGYTVAGNPMNDDMAVDIASDWFCFRHQLTLGIAT